MTWKVGDYGWISGSEAHGLAFKKAVKVEVVGVIPGDLHPLKVACPLGTFYVSENELQTRAAKAERKPAKLIVPEEIKAKAAELAEEKMRKMEKGKPKFEDVMKWFYSLTLICNEADGSSLQEPSLIVKTLAEEAIYERVKDGVTK